MNYRRHLFLSVLCVTSFLSSRAVHAGSATWNLNPTSGDWNTASNWMPNTVPNGTDDIATFGVSNITDITQSMTTTLGGMQFEPGAGSYNINVLPGNTFSLNDAGVTNDSGVTQAISCSTSTVDFYNASTAGENVIYTNTDTNGFISSLITFHDDATAGSATFIANGMPPYGAGEVVFTNNATAGSSHITVNGVFGFGSLGAVYFYDDSTAAESTVLYDMGAIGVFDSQATAANSTLTCSGNSSIYFFGNSTAGAATITGSADGSVNFQDSATAGTAAITCSADSVIFQDFATAGAATITADGATVQFQERSDGGGARIVLTHDSTLIVDRDRPVFRLGSFEGDGTANNQSCASDRRQ